MSGPATTELHEAARDGDVERVRQLLASGAELMARDDTQWTPLGLAAAHAHVETVRVLLEAGADPNTAVSFCGLTEKGGELCEC